MSDKPVTEADLNALLDEKKITKLRKEGDTRLSNLTQSQVDAMRYRAKNDLFFLSYAVLGYSRLSVNLHGSLCTWMMKHRDKQFKEILLPRSHFKSTVATVSDGIRIALPDVGEDAEWPANLGTNCRILICHEAKEKAGKFLYEITQHFLSNPMLMALFPECVPTPKVHRINLSELELPRTEKWGEATYSTMGTGGRNQGAHFNYLKLDDLIGDVARDSPTVMQGAKEWFDNIQAFFSSFVVDHMDIVGTRWAFDDLYAHVEEQYGAELFKYVRGAEEIVDGKLTPIFPEEFTTKSFQILKKNKKVWAAQYANDPTLGATEFDLHWKRSFTFDGPHRIRARTLTGSSRVLDLLDLDVCILIDPALTGLTGLVVTGVDSLGNTYILEALKDSWSSPDLTDLVFKLVHRWNPRVVAVEKVLFSALYEHYWKEAMKSRGKTFRIEPVSTKNVEKDARIRGLSNYFAAGQIFFHPDHKDLHTEFAQFGASDNTHMLDALAMGPKVWRKGVNMQKLEENSYMPTAAETGRDPIGGY